MKSLLVLLIVIVTFSATHVASQETDDAALNEYFKKYRAPRTIFAFQNVLDRQKLILQHNLRFKERLETFNKTLNELSQLSLEEISKYKLGALADDPKEERVVVNASEARTGRAITPPASFLWPESVTGRVKSQGSCGECLILTS